MWLTLRHEFVFAQNGLAPPDPNWPTATSHPRPANSPELKFLPHVRPSTPPLYQPPPRPTSLNTVNVSLTTSVTMSAARLALRSPTLRFATRRFQSTSTEKATEAAKDTASKASQGLSKVSSAAGPAISGAARGIGNTLTKIGGPAGRLVGFVERKFDLCLTVIGKSGKRLHEESMDKMRCF